MNGVLLLLCALLAQADDDDLPSALDGLLTSDEPGQRIIRNDAGPSEATGAWYVWPMSMGSSYPYGGDGPDLGSGFLGVAVGRRGYSIGGGSGYLVDLGVSGLFPMGPRTKGRLLRGYLLGGPRSRYLSLLLGPVLVHNELHLQDTADLSAAAFAGAVVQLMVDLGPLTVALSGEPQWRLTGDRSGADWTSLKLPGFGDEWVWTGGVSMSVHRHWRIQVGERIWLSEIGAFRSVTVGVGIQ